MDLATIIGIVVAGGSILWAMYEGTHGKLSTFVSGEGVVLVVGGSFAAVCLSMPLRSVLSLGGYLKNWMFSKEMPIEEIIKRACQLRRSRPS